MIRKEVTIEDYEGKLAINLGGSYNPDKPQWEADLAVYNIRASDYPDLIRLRTMAEIVENHISVYQNGRWLAINGDSRIMVRVTPVQKPGRGGKDWQWKWSYGKWIKSYL